MKKHHPPKNRLLTAVALGVLALANAAHAQTDPQTPPPAQPAAQPAPAAAPESLMRVEVTGTSIKRLASEAALPVTTVKAAEFQQRGYTTLADLMMALPQSISLQPSNAGAGSNINLRGLGVNRTLVLVNGRRLANEPTADGFASIDYIPMSALDRVEVLNDGASSIYGSDAIGGVVNFITKKSYKGAALTLQAVQPSMHGGGAEQRGSFIVGKGDLDADGWNVFATLDAHQRSRLAQADRPYLTDVARQTALGYPPSAATGTYAFPANVLATISGKSVAFNPYYATGCEAPYSVPGAKNTCVLNSAEYNTALYGNSQVTFYSKGTLKLSDDHMLSVEYMRGMADILSVRNPATSASITTVTPSTATAVITPASSIYYPGGSGGTPAIAGITNQPLTVEYSSPTLAGTRDKQINQRIVVNDEGTIKGWDYKAGIDLGINNRFITLDQGILNGQLLNAGISNGTINPFGAQSAAGQAYLDSITLDGLPLRAAKSAYNGIDVTANHELWDMGGGAAIVALGADMHWDRVRDTKEANGTYAAPVAATPTFAASSREVAAVFAELNLPITKALEVDLAARDDHYNDVGNTINPKASFRYQPTKWVMFRGAVSTGFRAPTLSDLHGYRLPGATTTTSAVMDDPVLCPGGTNGVAGTGAPIDGYAASQVCNIKQPLQNGSNPNITPEKSKNATLGVVFEPTQGATLSLDYWNIRMTNMIAVLPQLAFLNNPIGYENLIVRNAPTAGHTIGTIEYIMDDSSNLGGQHVSGIDVSGSYQIKTATKGVFTLGIDGTYLLQFENQLYPGGPWASNVGRFGLASNGTTSSLPILSFRWKHVLRAAWQYGDWTTQVTESFNSRYDDQNTTAIPADNNHVIPSYSLVNWSATYTGFRHFTLIGGVNNVFNRMPPSTNSSLYSGNGYTLMSAANPIGRAYSATVTYTF